MGPSVISAEFVFKQKINLLSNHREEGEGGSVEKEVKGKRGFGGLEGDKVKKERKFTAVINFSDHCFADTVSLCIFMF